MFKVIAGAALVLVMAAPAAAQDAKVAWKRTASYNRTRA